MKLDSIVGNFVTERIKPERVMGRPQRAVKGP
jgi:hypothetical protein